MHGITKKICISVLTVVLVLITMFATTYAWVGIFTYSSTDSFNMNLKVEDIDQNYFLTISTTGEAGTFSESISETEIKRQILKNRNLSNIYVNLDTASSDEIEAFFIQNANLLPVTTSVDENNELTSFVAVNYSNTKRFETYKCNDYYKMDVYLSVDTKEGIQENTEVNSNIFISEIESALQGTVNVFRFKNGNPFLGLPSDSMSEVLQQIPGLENFNVNSRNAARFALSIYEPIPIEDSYGDSNLPLKTIIYQGGSQTPIYDLSNNTYDLGGNLPEDYNAALQELLMVRPNYSKSSVPDYRKYYNDCLNTAVERGRNDLELTNENSTIWAAPSDFSSSYLGVYQGVQTKIKMSIYFWFEGWDADCLEGIHQQPVSFNLAFTAEKD